MKVFMLDGPGVTSMVELEDPFPAPDEAVVAVDRVGVCGTDLEFFRGTQPYLAAGKAKYPLRIGHEWCGRVIRIGDQVDPEWLGRRVTGDTMLGCRRCEICQRGRQHLCPNRSEIGVLNGRAGALAEQLAVPASTLYALPDSISDVTGALIEPATLALRSIRSLALPAGERVLVWGLGVIGLATVLFGRALGFEVAAVARSDRSLSVAREFGAVETYTEVEILERADASFEGVIAASPAAEAPGLAMVHLRDGGVMTLVGISGEPSLIEARDLVTRDITARGLLSGSPCFSETIELLSGPLDVQIEQLVGAVLPFAEAREVFSDSMRATGPKVQVAVSAGKRY